MAKGKVKALGITKSLFPEYQIVSTGIDFNHCFPKPSDIILNKNKKTISVSNAFNLNRIPIKVIAPYDVWIRWEKQFLKNNCFISLRSIKPYIYKNTKEAQLNIEALVKYCKDVGDDFAWSFYYFFIHEANGLNPKFYPARKSRGKQKYWIKKNEAYKVRMVSRHIYVFLQYWFQQPTRNYPRNLEIYLKKHSIISEMVLTVTIEIINQYFDLNKDKTPDEKAFYDKYIACQSLTQLKQAYKSINFELLREPLLSIFQVTR